MAQEISETEAMLEIEPAESLSPSGLKPPLEVVGLIKNYGRRRVVDGVSFYVDHDEIVGLLGPNGAGKTTSFRIACGMIDAEAGKVYLNGIDVTNWPMYRRAREGNMGYLAQESSVFRKLTVEQNLLAIMELLGMDRAAAASGATICWTSSTLRGSASRWPCHSRAASAAGWKSPGPWSPIPR